MESQYEPITEDRFIVLVLHNNKIVIDKNTIYNISFTLNNLTDADDIYLSVYNTKLFEILKLLRKDYIIRYTAISKTGEKACIYLFEVVQLEVSTGMNWKNSIVPATIQLHGIILKFTVLL